MGKIRFHPNNECAARALGLEMFRGSESFHFESLREKKISDFKSFYRAVLKGTNLRGQTPICGFVRVPAFSAVSCEICAFPRKSALPQCENLRLGSVYPLGFVP